MLSDSRDLGNISAEGPAAEHQTVVKGRILSRGKSLVIGCTVVSLLLLFGGKVALDVYEREERVISDRIQVLEGDLRKYSALNLKFDDLGRKILGIQERVEQLGKQSDDLVQKITDLKDNHIGNRGWESKYRRVASQLEVLRRDVALLRDRGDGPRFAKGGALLTLAHLQVNLARGKPCLTELQVMRSFFSESLDIVKNFNELSVPCEKGITTRHELQRNFGVVAREIMSSSDLPDDATWLERVRSALTSLVTVRPVGPQVVGRDPAALLAQTEGFLASGNLSDALTSIRGLGIARGIGLDWTNDLEAHVLAMGAVDDITAFLIGTKMDGPAHNE